MRLTSVIEVSLAATRKQTNSANALKAAVFWRASFQLNDAQRERDDRFLISTSTAGALPHSGFILLPKADVKGWCT